MNHYQLSSPPKVLALAAVALTAITIGLAVVVPAKMEPGAQELRTVAGFTVTATNPDETARNCPGVDMNGSIQARTPMAKGRQEG